MMKLYIWKGDDVLPQYRGGMAGAIASSVDIARKLVVKAYMEEYEYEETDRDLAVANLPFLDRKCDVEAYCDYGFTMMGSA